MADVWLPRIYAMGQCAMLVVCGVLIGMGKDSVITDLFCAAGGSIIGTAVVPRVAAVISKK